MADTIQTIKTYGAQLKINGDVDLPGVILSDIKMTPTFDVTTVDQGKQSRSAIRTLTGVEFSATATLLASTSVPAIEPNVEKLVSELVVSESLAPAGGSTIVEIGEVNLLPGEAQTVSVKATYHPGMTKTTE